MLELVILLAFLAQIVLVPLVASTKGQSGGLWFMCTFMWAAMFSVVLFGVVTGSIFSASGLLPWEEPQSAARIVSEVVAGLLLFTPLLAVAMARDAGVNRRYRRKSS